MHSPLAQLALYPNLHADPSHLAPMAALVPNPFRQRRQLQPGFRVDWRDLFKRFPVEEAPH